MSISIQLCAVHYCNLDRSIIFFLIYIDSPNSPNIHLCVLRYCIYIYQVGCQYIQHHASKPDNNNESHQFSLDLPRTIRFGLMGFFVHAPFFGMSMSLIDRVFTHSLHKTVVATAVLGPTYMSLFFPIMVGFERLVPSEQDNSRPDACEPTEQEMSLMQAMRTRLEEKWFTSTSIALGFWSIANFINFALAPPSLRLHVNLAFSLVWNAGLSYLNAVEVSFPFLDTTKDRD